MFEIITETEVTHHFKESMVTCGIADVFQVIVFATGAHAFLRGHGTAVWAFVKAQKHVFELVHTSIGKEQGRVVMRHERAGGHYRVPLTLEKREKFLAYFGCFHAEFLMYMKLKETCGQSAGNRAKYYHICGSG